MGDLWVVLRLAEEQCVFIQTDKTHNVFFVVVVVLGGKDGLKKTEWHNASKTTHEYQQTNFVLLVL